MPAEPSRNARVPVVVVSCILFLLLFALYAYTAAPEVTFHDSGELITAAVTLGIPHPPGSPLWCLVGHLFTKLPFGSYAFRVHLMSGFFAALACVFVYLLVVDIARGPEGSPPRLRHHLSGLLAAVLLAQSPSFWEKAVQAELYAMNAFFLAAIAFVLWRWLAHNPPAPADDRKLVLIAALFGLGMANYQALSFFVPSVALIVAFRHPALFRKPRLLIGLALAGLAGLALYAYLPIRSAANPALDWGNPETWAGFRSVVGREHWGSLRWTQYSWEFLRLWLLSIDPISELGFPALLLAAAGLAVLLLRQRAMAAFLILSFVVYGVWMMIMQAMTGTLNPSLYYITFYGMGEFHIPLYLLLAVAAGVGANEAAERIAAHPRFAGMPPSNMTLLGLAALALCVGPSAIAHLPQGNFRHYTQPHAYAARVLDSLEPNSWLFGTGDAPHFAVAYLKFCERRREDVAILTARDFYFDELDEMGRARDGRVSASDFVEKMAGAESRYIEPRYHQEIPLDPERAAVYFTILPTQETIASNLYPRGLVFQLGDRGGHSMDEQGKFWKGFLADPEFALNRNSKHDFREMMAVVLEQHAGWHLQHEEYALARVLCRKCIEYSPAPRPDAVDKLAGALLGLGQLEEAIATCKVAIELNYRNKWAWTTLARIYADRGETRKAITCLESILLFDPQDAEIAETVQALRLTPQTNAPARR